MTIFSRNFSDGFRDRGELLRPEGDNAGKSGPALPGGAFKDPVVVLGVVGATSAVGGIPLGMCFGAAFALAGAFFGALVAAGLALGGAFFR